MVDDPALRRWDEYNYEIAAARAVRNRKVYFKALVSEHARRRQPMRVLNLAAGPGRDVYEWLVENTGDVCFTCVEIDPAAISFARNLNRHYLDRVSFLHENALRFRPAASFDLIWSGGLFDYFSDRVFTTLLRRLLRALAPGGELAIGNFSVHNPSRPYMEVVGQWFLEHRTSDHLRSLAQSAGVDPGNVRIDSEDEGVNLFLRITPD
jgi:SAM-dependent methyltransferase